MARKTAVEETTRLMEQFFVEADEGLVMELKLTRQPKRRKLMLATLDSLDTVRTRYYHWLNGQTVDKSVDKSK